MRQSRKIVWFAVLAGLLVASAGARGAEPSADLRALQDRKHAFIDALVEPIVRCVGRRDTDHAIFRGCIDWHSSVHGYWALTAAARVAGRGDLAALVRAALDRKSIAGEREYLRAHPDFEMPYGRAWFLRLAIEFERSFGDRRLRAMADDVAASLRRHYTNQTIDPLSHSYRSASWALLNLRAYGSHTGRRDLVAFVDGAVAEHFVPYRVPCPPTVDIAERSFMAVCTNWAWLVSRTMGKDRFRIWLAGFLPDPGKIEPVKTATRAHLHGLNFSRAWGLWRLYKQTGDGRYLTLYRRHFEPTFERTEWWDGDYGKIGHWVGQFGVFAIMPLFEPDYF